MCSLPDVTSSFNWVLQGSDDILVCRHLAVLVYPSIEVLTKGEACNRLSVAVD